MGIYRTILQLLLLNQGLPKYFGFSDTDKVMEISRGIFIEEEFPYMAPILKEIVGDEVWQAAKQGLGYEVHLRLKKSSG